MVFLEFYVESDFQKTHQEAFRTKITIQNLNSFYRAKTDLKFVLFFWGKESWKENDGRNYDGIFVPNQQRLIFDHWLWKDWFWNGLCLFFLIWAQTDWKKANLQSQELVFVPDLKKVQVYWNKTLKNKLHEFCRQYVFEGASLELLKTYNGKFNLKFLSVTVVKFDNCQVWQLSSRTVVKLNSCQATVAENKNI